MGSNGKSRVLIVGATGHIGQPVTSACLQAGHPTFILARSSWCQDVAKVQQLLNFRRGGAQIVWNVGLDDREALVKVLKRVDVVICTISHFQLHEQHKLVDAIIQAGNIKKFYPSEFGADADHAEPVPPCDSVYREKIKIRRRIEAAGIPYTYISANLFMGYYLLNFAQLDLPYTFLPPRDKVVIHGDGETKVIWVAEEDVGTYTVKTIDDPRTLNKTVYFRPPKNILTMNQHVALWESKIGKELKKTWITKEELFAKYIENESLPMFQRAVSAQIYQIFHRGDLCFDLQPESLDASKLYPEVEYTTASEYLDLFV